MEFYKQIKDQMVPSEAAQMGLREKIEAARPAPKGNLWLKRAVPLAACLLLMVGVAVAYQQLRPGTIEPPTPSTTAAQGGEITGLPIGQPNSGTSCEKAIEADRGVFTTLKDFFIHGDIKTFVGDMKPFVLARVTDTKLLPAEHDYQSGRLQSTLEIIEWTYNEPVGAQEPMIITLTQPLYHDNVESCVGEPILLRRGGVYLLPLFEFEGTFYIMNDVDVLFEVDEHGNIFSHSSISDFAAYDGKPLQNLMEDIRAIARDNPLLVQYPRFARVLLDEVPLAVVAILDGGTKHSSYLTQRARAEQIFIRGTGKRWQVSLSEGEFSLNTYGHEAKALPGERYLVFIYGNEAEYSFQPENAARINADGTITPLESEWSDRNVFDELAGMTVEQVRALIDKVE